MRIEFSHGEVVNPHMHNHVGWIECGMPIDHPICIHCYVRMSLVKVTLALFFYFLKKKFVGA